MARVRVLEHVVGPLLPHGVQECSRCGEVLTDYRNAMVPEGSPLLRGLAEGQRWVRRVGEGGAVMGMSREFTGELAVPCDPLLEHVAGEPGEKTQACSRCGVVVLQYTKHTPRPEDFAPVGEVLVATATVVMPRTKWEGPTCPCKGKAGPDENTCGDCTMPLNEHRDGGAAESCSARNELDGRAP